MGFLDSVKSWFSREAADVKASVDDLEQRFDADLDRKERELAATPEEKIEMLQADTSSDDLLAEVQAKIDAQQGKALANEELIEIEDQGKSE